MTKRTNSRSASARIVSKDVKRSGCALSTRPPLIMQVAEARMRAKAKLQQRDRSTGPPPSALGKRPLEIVPADSTSPTAPSTRSFPGPQPEASGSGSVRDASARLTRATMSPTPGLANGVATRANKPTGQEKLARDENYYKNYIEYDLSTLKNSKGGFLLGSEDDDERAAKQQKIAEDLKKERQREAERRGANEQHDALLGLRPPEQDPRCENCRSIELDMQISRHFNVFVCPKCRNEHPDKYSLLTKTECKLDYLLTDPELKDAELLPHMLKANPHRSTYANMFLYLRKQVEEFAFSDKKWGSEAALDAEFERREAEKKKKKNAKFESRLRDLRRKTKETDWHRRQDAVHVHAFSDTVITEADGTQKQYCECGFSVEVESF